MAIIHGGSGSKALTQHTNEVPTSLLERLPALERRAVELYGRGYKRREAARVLMKYFKGQTRELKMRKALNFLRRAEQNQMFRDALWEQALVYVDMSSFPIARAMVRHGVRGKVDAAKFALELSGRYTNNSGERSPQVTINFGSSIPRPDREHLELTATEEPARLDEEA
jgi:hypothetical protein